MSNDVQWVELQVLHRVQGLLGPLDARPSSSGPQALLAEDEAMGGLNVEGMNDDLLKNLITVGLGVGQRSALNFKVLL